MSLKYEPASEPLHMGTPPRPILHFVPSIFQICARWLRAARFETRITDPESRILDTGSRITNNE